MNLRSLSLDECTALHEKDDFPDRYRHLDGYLLEVSKKDIHGLREGVSCNASTPTLLGNKPVSLEIYGLYGEGMDPAFIAQPHGEPWALGISRRLSEEEMMIHVQGYFGMRTSYKSAISRAFVVVKISE